MSFEPDLKEFVALQEENHALRKQLTEAENKNALLNHRVGEWEKLYENAKEEGDTANRMKNVAEGHVESMETALADVEKHEKRYITALKKIRDHTQDSEDDPHALHCGKEVIDVAQNALMIKRAAEQEQLLNQYTKGRGGDPECDHETVERLPGDRWRCSDCFEGFMSHNDAQVLLIRESRQT